MFFNEFYYLFSNFDYFFFRKMREVFIPVGALNHMKIRYFVPTEHLAPFTSQ